METSRTPTEASKVVSTLRVRHLLSRSPQNVSLIHAMRSVASEPQRYSLFIVQYSLFVINVYCSILNTCSYAASLEVCIDPDSRGMTVSVALYTLESHPDPSRKTSNVQRKTYSKHSDRQSGDTSECFFIWGGGGR